MTSPSANSSSAKTTANALLQTHGVTFAEELDIPLSRNNPSSLFRLLCAAQLFSARVQASIAVETAKALVNQGWNTPQKLLDATWEERTACLNRAGYSRYDERTATMLADLAQLLVNQYDGDLRQLREVANRNLEQERDLLTKFKGIGPVGATIFLREVQVVWEEVFPFADARALETARTLRLPDRVDALRELVGDAAFPRLVAALVRVRLAHDEDEILEKA